MSTLMLVNPRKRRRKSNPTRSAAQRRATRALVASNRAKRSSNPKRRRKNPARSYHAVTRRKNPISSYRHHARRHKRRRNPISLPSMGGVAALLKAGALGASGALAIDFALGNLPLPDAMLTRTNSDGSTNYLYFGGKIALAVGLGLLGKRFLGAKAATMAEGAMVVNLYDFFRTMMPTSVKLGYFTPAPIARSMKAYVPGRAQMGAYVPNGSTATGTNPAMATHLGGFRPGVVVTRGRMFSRG